MYLQHLNVYFFFGLMFVVGTVVFFLFQPFLTAIIAAAMLAVLFQRPHRWLVRKTGNHPAIASFLSCLLIILVIVVPLFFVVTVVANEANSLYQSFGQERALDQAIGRIVYSIRNIPFLDMMGADTLSPETVFRGIHEWGGNFLDIFQTAYREVSQFMFWVFILFFTLYYFFIDGERGVRYLMTVSPLRDEHDALLIKKFVSMTRATIKGTLVIGVIQSFVGAILFFAVGVPSPMVWATLMLLFSIIPMIGTAAVWFPLGIILLFLGDLWQGALVLGVGFGIISVIDNVFKHKLVGKDTQMHPLLILLSTLGGIAFFGLSGFILGPIVMALFMALWEIYVIEFHKQLTSYNDPMREYRKEETI
jgi:predicted PurR-regulated permease PerM